MGNHFEDCEDGDDQDPVDGYPGRGRARRNDIEPEGDLPASGADEEEGLALELIPGATNEAGDRAIDVPQLLVWWMSSGDPLCSSCLDPCGHRCLVCDGALCSRCDMVVEATGLGFCPACLALTTREA